MATTPGTSLASTACFSTPSMRARDCGALPWAWARPLVIGLATPTDVATATAAAPFNRSRRLGDVGVIVPSPCPLPMGDKDRKWILRPPLASGGGENEPEGKASQGTRQQQTQHCKRARTLVD